MERLTISIFSLLSKLISVDNEALRNEACSILGSVDVGQILEGVTRRCELAEQRAQEAEDHIQELVDEIEDLQEENESLHQQILVYSTSSALT
jgi:predicted  nucleic acid-binding Zn-ribbon protein